jgi:hypothetical protein
MIKKQYPSSKVGISLNTVHFESESMLAGWASRFADSWFNERCADTFAPHSDFQGMSYCKYCGGLSVIVAYR